MWHKPFTCCNDLQMHLHEEQKDLNWWFSKWFTTGQNLRLHKNHNVSIQYRPAFPESFLWISRLNLCEFWSNEDETFYRKWKLLIKVGRENFFGGPYDQSFTSVLLTKTAQCYILYVYLICLSVKNATSKAYV